MAWKNYGKKSYGGKTYKKYPAKNYRKKKYVAKKKEVHEKCDYKGAELFNGQHSVCKAERCLHIYIDNNVRKLFRILITDERKRHLRLARNDCSIEGIRNVTIFCVL